VSLDLSSIQKDFPCLILNPKKRERGATAYRLQLPELPWGREFAWAELLLPRGFPEHETASIILSPDAVLRVPHVEITGALCIEGDPGPGQGHTAEERIHLLLLAYHDQFLQPWLAGKLDEDFSKESLNYWTIAVSQKRSNRDPVCAVWTVDECPNQPNVMEGLLLLPGRLVVANNGKQAITNRVIQSLGSKAKQRIRVLVADIPISHTFTPSTWPSNNADFERLLNGRLSKPQREQFRRPPRLHGRGVHRIVLLRNLMCGFAYLLPGGPPTIVEYGAQKRSFPSLSKPLPLSVTRVDPSWTVGRDQHPVVTQRLSQHVLVFGAGALGSPVVDHLAKAGIGFITLVDPENMETTNIGRHLLGAESLDRPKAEAVAERVNLGHPATLVTAKKMSAERWLRENSLTNFDLILDMTGESDVRWYLDQARLQHSCPLLIGWMEPYVAAAHVCMLPAGATWMQGFTDPMKNLQAITWPDEVIQLEPGCSSRFQSYTAAAAAHAIALVAEQSLKLLEHSVIESQIISWVRGQRYLDEHWEGLKLREWALKAQSQDGIIIERLFP